MSKYEGVICVLKPPGMSSSDAVTDIRRVFDEKRVGHTGTLDPAAAGVLPICIGRAARLFDYLVDKQKTYIAEIAFGAATDTEDATGRVLETSDRVIGQDELISVLPRFTGEIEQTPPAYSALNVNGVKLYKLARRGELTEAPEIKKRSITVYGLKVIRQTGVNRYLIEIVCSKGTYIRTLCKDIGVALGCPAHMAFLLRTASGAFTIEESFSIAELNEMKEKGELNTAVIPTDRAIAHIPEARLQNVSAKKTDLLIKGAGLKVEGLPRDKPLRVYVNDSFMGLGVCRNGVLKLTVWLGDEAMQVKGVKLNGTVGENRHIGTGLGFPTANLEGYDKKQLPPEGVYATVAVLEDVRYRSVTSIGTNPTVGGRSISVETHIIGFDGDCYGKALTVIFVHWLREMRRFPSVEELKKQIAADMEASMHCSDSIKYLDCKT